MQPLDKDALNSLQITSMREDTSEVIEPLRLRSDLLDSRLVPILIGSFLILFVSSRNPLSSFWGAV